VVIQAIQAQLVLVLLVFGYSGTQSNIAVSDQGSLLTSSVSSFNFAGDLVTATTVGGAVTVTVENPIVYSNTIWSWGCNGYDGRLGTNSEVVRSSPVSVVGGIIDWCQISAGGQHTLALRTNSTLWGWGLNSSGQLGRNNTTNRSSPVQTVSGGNNWKQVSVGCAHTAAIREEGDW
jgi:alpha-tubulin suppressor-like RCC1 family protein